MTISFDPTHLQGDTVYIKTDPSQLPRLIFGYNIVPNGDNLIIKYEVTLFNKRSLYFDFELSNTATARVYDSFYDKEYD